MSAGDYEGSLEKLARARAGDSRAREEVIRENLGLVKYIVRRFAGRGAEYDDLYQYGCMGLIKAVDRFDPDYPVRFSTYAVPVIMGEIRRYLRDDGPIHVSRTIRERAGQVEAYIQSFSEAHHRSPDVNQIAGALDMDPSDVVLAMNSHSRVRSLEEPAGQDSDTRLMDVLGTDPMRGVESRLTLSKLLRDLSPEDRALIVRRYFLSHTQTQIARDLGTSQVQVSRMEIRIIKHMRAMAGVDEA